MQRMSTVRRSKRQSISKSMKVTAEDVFNLLDFDMDGRIESSELREAVLSTGIPAEKKAIQAKVDQLKYF